MAERGHYNQGRQGQARRGRDEERRFSDWDYERSQNSRRGREDDERRRNFGVDDQELEQIVGRYDQGSDYGTSFGRHSHDAERYERNGHEDTQDYRDRSRRRLSAGSERPYSAQPSSRQYPSEQGPGNYYGQGSINEAWRQGRLDYAGDRSHQPARGSMVGREGSQYEQTRQSQSESSFFGRGPKGYQRSDERIHEEVSDCLADHYEVDASDIEVKVEAGHVILTGTVDSRRTKRLAEDAVENVRGVKDVSNQIRVQSAQDKNATTSLSAKGQAGGKQKGESLHA